jgi:catechol 2,3-dioxygenase-like lactoylglutathione lyase family enzyme
MKRTTALLAFALLWPFAVSQAQTRAPNEQGVSMGQWYTIVRDLGAAQKFWSILGGEPMKIDGIDAFKFPGVFVFLSKGEPTGETVGSVINHTGFHSSKGPELVAKLKAAGIKMDAAAGTRLPDANGSSWGNVFSPDGVKVEILDSARSTAALGISGMPAPSPLTGSISSDHVHIYVPEPSVSEAQAWYAKVFGATPFSDTVPRPNEPVAAGDLPGVEMKFSKSSGTLAPTKGRALDHIGFEVKNLQAFCKKLEADGVKFDQPYSKTRHKGYASAELTDPWGTSIELTEGLNKL